MAQDAHTYTHIHTHTHTHTGGDSASATELHGEGEEDGAAQSIISEKFWNSLKLNISFLYELKEWIAICNHEFRFENKESDKEFLREAASLLPKDTANENCWNLWLNEIKKKTNRKGKDLFMPIRLALSGKEHGPELKFLVNLIEREEILKRLQK